MFDRHLFNLIVIIVDHTYSMFERLLSHTLCLIGTYSILKFMIVVYSIVVINVNHTYSIL